MKNFTTHINRLFCCFFCLFIAHIAWATPTITTQPAGQVACVSTSVTFSVSATPGSGVLGYQWRKDGVNLSGQTSSTLTLSSITTANAGNYSVVVSDATGSVTSSDATLTVVAAAPTGAALTINGNPASGTVAICPNATVIMGVNVATGTNLSYQWSKAGTPITGATNATYTIAAMSSSDQATYRVSVTNACGSTVSNNISLSLSAATTISNNPSNQSACAGGSVTFTASATGTGTISYQWQKNGNNITGQNNASLTLTNIPSTDNGATYRVVATGTCGSATSSSATLTVGSGPSITAHPVSVVPCPGTNVTFSVTASGATGYQWKKDGNDIAGQTGSSLTLSNVNGNNDNGNYTVLVSNGCGSSLSNAANLTVGSAPVITLQPASQSVCDGSFATFSFTLSTNSTGPFSYQWYRNNISTPVVGATNATYTVQAITANVASYLVRITGACGSATSTAADLTQLNTISITTQPVAQRVCPGTNTTFSVVATGTSLTYQWQRDGNNVGTNSATLSLTNVAATDTGFYRVIIGSACGSSQSSTVKLRLFAATTILSHPSSTIICPSDAVAFRVTATGEGAVSYQWRKSGINITGQTNNTLAFSTVTSLDSAGVYDVVVTASCGSLTSNTARITINPITTITSQPANTTVCLGANTALNVGVRAGTPISYQWRKNGSNISNAATLALNAVPLTDNNAKYDVVITGACGNATSSQATLTVDNPLIASVDADGSTTFCNKKSVNFTVKPATNPTGSTPQSYNWSTGANTATVNISTEGTFWVEYTNSNGCKSSQSTVTTTVLPLPTTPVVTASSSPSFCYDKTVELVSTPDNSYNWSNGSTAQKFTTNISGNYSLTVTGTNGCVSDRSNTVTVTVFPKPATPTLVYTTATTFCTGDSIVFSLGNVPANATAYRWSPLVFTDADDVPTNRKVGKTSGDYTGRYKDVNGCLSDVAAFVNVKVNPLPTKPIITPSGTTTVCPKTLVDLESSAELQYRWSNGQSTKKISTDQVGKYAVRVIDINGCVSVSSDTVTIKNHPLPDKPTIKPDGDLSFCEGRQVTLASSAESKYRWSTAETTQNIVVKKSGKYAVTVFNQFGCPSVVSDTIEISVFQLPVVPFIIANSNLSFCQGGQVTLTTNSPFEPRWSTGETTRSITVKNSSTITLKVIDNNSCISKDSDPKVVTVKANPSAPVIKITGPYTIDVVGGNQTGQETYLWKFNNTDIPQNTSGIKINDNGKYAAIAKLIYPVPSPQNTLECASVQSNVVDFSLDPFNAIFAVYPNPAVGDLVNVELAQTTDNVQLSIVDMSGQVLYSELIPNFSGKKTIDVSQLSGQHYLVRVNRGVDINAGKKLMIFR